MKWTAALPAGMISLSLIAGSYCVAQNNESEILARYAACRLPAGPEVVETAPLAPGVERRPVQTRRGQAMVEMVAGKRVMFAYPGEDFYANVKAERLRDATYSEEKQLLIEDFDHTLATGGDTARNYALRPRLNGFEFMGWIAANVREECSGFICSSTTCGMMRSRCIS